MALLERARTDLVVVDSFVHDPGESPSVCEWWSRSCLAFTTFGSWEVRSRRGRGEVRPDTLLVGDAGGEYDCRHPDGLDDRALCITYRIDVEPAPALLLPLTPRLHALRRALTAELRLADPCGDEIDAICLALLELARDGSGRLRQPKARTQALIARLRAEAESRYTEPTLDLVAEASALGLSRTRLVHSFREIVGVTPHRYLVELRTAHAARLLTQTRTPVSEVCFDSGFGSMARFHAAFRAAFGTTPTAYRERHTTR